MELTATGLIELLQRWEEFGGIWQVTARHESTVKVSLYRCDGGEEVQQLWTRDQEMSAFLDERLRVGSDPGSSGPQNDTASLAARDCPVDR